jgi:hypothetical protein
MVELRVATISITPCRYYLLLYSGRKKEEGRRKKEEVDRVRFIVVAINQPGFFFETADKRRFLLILIRYFVDFF